MSRAGVLREEWLARGLSTEPADRPVAEAAVARLYHLLGAPEPEFHWVPSPAAALPVLREAGHDFGAAGPETVAPPARHTDWPLAARLASLASELRDRMDARVARRARPSVGIPLLETVGSRSVDEALERGVPWEVILRSVVHDPLRRTLVDAVRAPLRAALLPPAAGAASMTWFGQHDAYWVADHDIRARVGASAPPGRDAAPLGLWTDLARSAGWWWPRDRLCVLSERPSAVHTEPLRDDAHGERRLHRPDGPAVEYADGTRGYALHGTHVPEWVVHDPSVERIHAEPNVEIRRSAIERLGWDTYIRQAGLRRVGRAPDPGNPGGLLDLYDAPRRLLGRPARLLLVVNGSAEADGGRRRYGLTVPDHFDDPVAAAGWTYGLAPEQYARLVRRT
ncbi:hypothetical protein HOY81_19645 [Streptomyces sp. JJ36]|nr:hypothetical protein [Streptomyces sp. JJ36]